MIAQTSTGLKGKILVSVMNHDGSIAKAFSQPIKNLWLDQGLDKLATMLIPDAFAVCAKGDGQAATKEVPDASNTYSWDGAAVVTRITSPATPRNFVSGDVGKLLRFSNGAELMIVSISSTTIAGCRPVGLLALPAAFSTKTAIFYNVQLTGLTTERFTTPFLSNTCTKVEGVATITANASVFTSGMVGQAIYIRGAAADGGGLRYMITAQAGTTATVDDPTGAFTSLPFVVYRTQGDDLDTPLSRTAVYSLISGENSTSDNLTTGVRTLKRTFVFSPEPSNVIFSSVGTGTYSWGGTAVVRLTGSHTFTSADVGNYLQFSTGGEYCVIISQTGANCVVDRAAAGSHVSDTIQEFGQWEYDSISLSDSDDPDPVNANVLVRLEDGGGSVTPVLVNGQNPEFPGQQLKIQYILTESLTPATVSARTNFAISDPAHAMSASKFGTCVVEAIALAAIDSSGNTLTDITCLEPSDPGEFAMSTSFAALNNFNGPDRSTGSQAVGMEALGYVAGQFTQLYQGVFGVNDAIGPNYRTMGIYDIAANSFGFTMLFEVNQAKTGNVTFTGRFRKSWNRDLS